MEPTRRGIIDCIAAGFGVVHRIPALIAAPVLLDAFLWLVPRVSLAPLIERTAVQLQETAPEATASGSALPLGQQMAQFLEQSGDMNLLTVLGWQVPGFQSLFYTRGLAEGALASVTSWGQGIIIVAALAPLSILLASLYLGAIAEGVRSNALRPSLVLSRLGASWLRLSGYLFLVTLAALAGFLLLLQTWSALQAFNASLGALLLGLSLGAAFLAEIYLFLAKPAIFLDNLGPMAALRQSLSLAHRHFWVVLGLFLLSNVISIGLGLALASIAALPLGLLAAVLGNAYLATGLTATAMVFYRESTAPAHGTS